jgi:glucose/mannose transport system permease protein
MTVGRYVLYGILLLASAFYAAPLYVMIVTSLKTMDNIRLGELFSFPHVWTVEPWVKAWSGACTGLACEGIRPGFMNSVYITVPSVIVSIFAGALFGYRLSFWRSRSANFIFGILLFGGFLPFQVFIYPLVRIFAAIGLYNTLFNIVCVHTIFGLPVMTLLFRNYFASLPVELFKAARVDGAGFWRIFYSIMLPMATPVIIVAVILQVTGIWNDFLFGSIFAGRENWPMTVQLNNLVNTTQGERAYNVDMAATILTAAVPLLVYFVSGRWFVRGIAAGAVKG